eukprot:CAMPEP_0204007890 /NCGR_PEP_ID=MMETSP0360-20130528/20784_1 /ASSEMBLY_ACC=CAM_ASM_000342 /TAXON_ID=268821 /ORGANISM="Scrippsiella Hangoei, Strain SHTV-5" /LENGTH=166 /DNA_ID=CAMNT_0050950131 /DNA_START=124 /DNA_END=621 /DNA_ORIENTATION=-
MMSMGYIQTGFDVRTKGMELVFDPTAQQQLLNFHFAVQVSIPQLLQELTRFQRAEGLPPKPDVELPQDASGVANSVAVGVPMLSGISTMSRAHAPQAMHPAICSSGAASAAAATAAAAAAAAAAAVTTGLASTGSCGGGILRRPGVSSGMVPPPAAKQQQQQQQQQ